MRVTEKRRGRCEVLPARFRRPAGESVNNSNEKYVVKSSEWIFHAEKTGIVSDDSSVSCKISSSMSNLLCHVWNTLETLELCEEAHDGGSTKHMTNRTYWYLLWCFSRQTWMLETVRHRVTSNLYVFFRIFICCFKITTYLMLDEVNQSPEFWLKSRKYSLWFEGYNKNQSCCMLCKKWSRNKTWAERECNRSIWMLNYYRFVTPAQGLLPWLRLSEPQLVKITSCLDLEVFSFGALGLYTCQRVALD